jgi:type II secretory pathway pseudopilin PulG
MRLINKRFKKLESAGDTIVEVLMVLAVLSLAFAIATATANRGLKQSRNAEEHSQALGILNSQIELIRTAASSQVDVEQAGKPYCMTGTKTSEVFTSTNSDVPDSASTDTLTADGYPATCTQDDRYYRSVVYKKDPLDPGKDYVVIRVRWEGPGGLGVQQEIMNYRIHALTPTRSLNIPASSSPPQIVVKVKLIPPDTGKNTPSCGKAGGASKEDVGVRLTQLNGARTVRSASTAPNATFPGLVDSGSYQASITSLPSGGSDGHFEACNGGAVAALPVTSPAVTPPGGTTTEIEMTIRPVCRNVSGVGTPYLHFERKYVNLGTYSDTPAYAHYETRYAKAHPGPDWGPSGPSTPTKGPPNPRYGIGPPYVAVYKQWEPSVAGRGLVLAQYDQLKAGSNWYNRYEYWPYWFYLGTYSDTPAYAHYAWLWLPTTVYGDPYSYNVCPS